MHEGVAAWVAGVEAAQKKRGGKGAPAALPSGAALFAASVAVDALAAAQPAAVATTDSLEDCARVAACAAAAAHGTYALQRATAAQLARCTGPDGACVGAFRALYAADTPADDLAPLAPRVASCLANAAGAMPPLVAVQALRQLLHVAAAATSAPAPADAWLRPAVAGVVGCVSAAGGGGGGGLPHALALGVHALRSLATYHGDLRAAAPAAVDTLLRGTAAVAGGASDAAAASMRAATPVPTPLQARLLRAARNALRAAGVSVAGDVLEGETLLPGLHLRVDAVLRRCALVLEVDGPHHAAPLPVARAAAYGSDSAWQRLDRRDPSHRTLSTRARTCLLQGAGWHVVSLPWTLAHATDAGSPSRTFAACQAAVAAALEPSLAALR